MDEEIVILAGDMALHYGLALGWVYGDEIVYVASTHRDISETRKKRGVGAAGKESIDHIKNWVDQLGVTQLDKVIIEKPTPQGYHSYLIQFAMLSNFLIAADDLGADSKYQAIAPSTLKKLTTGYGRASKEEMIAAAEEWTGVPIYDDNEADAVCLLKHALIKESENWGK